MSKKAILIITLISIISIFGATSISCVPSEPSRYVTYFDEENGFSIDHPDNWNIDTPANPPELKVAIYEKEIGLNPVAIMVGKYQASGYNLESFTEFRKSFLNDNCRDYNSISTEKLMINGISATRHLYAETVGQTSYKKVEICLIDNGTGWIICFNSPEKSFDGYETIYNKAFNSFILIK
jgi:hypothetical protein